MRRQGTLKAKLIGRRWKVGLDWLLEFEAAPDNQCPKNNSDSDHTSLESGQTARVGAPAGSILRLDKHDVHLSAQKIFKRPSFGSRNMSQKKETVREAKSEHVLFEAILIRYWENHAQHLPSAEQAKYALAMWSDHFSEAAVSELTPQRQKSFVEALRAKGLRPSYISRVLSVGRAAIRFAWKQGELLTVPFIIDVHRD